MTWRNEWRLNYAGFLASAANLVLVVIGVVVGTTTAWTIVLTLVGSTSLIAWYGNLRRRRIIADIPTSKVASAPQGYVELVGRARQYDNDRLISRFDGSPCVWYRYIVERHDGENWERLDGAISQETFLLDDGTGRCVIDPDGAEILTTHKRTRNDGRLRYTEWRLLPDDLLYAIGEHGTENGADLELNVRKDVGALLAEWKRDKRSLLLRFDANRDGEIDLQEWERARAEAHHEVEQHHRTLRVRDGVHVLRKPRDGRLFVISNLSPDRMLRRYTFWGWWHLGVMVATWVAFGFVF